MENIEGKTEGVLVSGGNTENKILDDENAQAVDHKKETVIIVNTRPHKIFTKEVTYEEIVVFAFREVPIDKNPNIVITVTYRKGREPKPEGQLMPGQSVLVKDKMIFAVARTDKS